MSIESLSLPIGFAFSQSSLQDYGDCPRRFQLRYIERLRWPAIDTEPFLENERRQREGQAFHRIIQQHLIGLPVEKLSQNANTPDLSRWWQNFLGSKLKFPGYAQHVEITLFAPIGSYKLMAKYDLIAVKLRECAVIYDWKTYRVRPRDERIVARMQTRVYRAMLIQAGAFLNGGDNFNPEQIEMIYWYADFPSEPARFTYSTTQFTRDWVVLTELINEISNHRYFPLTVDEKICTVCPYRSYCNRGQEAGVLNEMAEMDSTIEDIESKWIAELEF